VLVLELGSEDVSDRNQGAVRDAYLMVSMFTEDVFLVDGGCKQIKVSIEE
jgi:hypothetical protein